MIALAREELAHTLLQVANDNLQNGLVNRDQIISINPIPPNPRPYPGQLEDDVYLALQNKRGRSDFILTKHFKIDIWDQYKSGKNTDFTNLQKKDSHLK